MVKANSCYPNPVCKNFRWRFILGFCLMRYSSTDQEQLSEGDYDIAAISHRPASCYHISHLSHLKIRLLQCTEVVPFQTNSKNIKWHRPLCLQTSTSPNGSMQHFANSLYGMRNNKGVSGFPSEERGSDLYSTLWDLSLYGQKSVFSCHTVNVVTGIYFQHT